MATHGQVCVNAAVLLLMQLRPCSKMAVYTGGGEIASGGSYSEITVV